MTNDPRRNVLNCALEEMSSGELKILLANLGYSDDVQVVESQAYKSWEFSQWYKPETHQLTDEEFRAKYGRDNQRTEDDGLEPGDA